MKVSRVIIAWSIRISKLNTISLTKYLCICFLLIVLPLIYWMFAYTQMKMQRIFRYKCKALS